MNALTNSQVDRIAAILQSAGIDSAALRDDLLDHICTAVEHSEGSFESALEMALAQFGGQAALALLQRQTRYALQHREKVRLERWVHRLKYGFGFAAIVSAMFKLMHWPGGNVLLVTACTAFIAFLLAGRYRVFRLRRMEKLTP